AWLPARFTTTPVTWPVAVGPAPWPVARAAASDALPPPLPPPDELAFPPPCELLDPPPGVLAFPFLTTQFSGAPSLSQGEGMGASLRRMFFPLMNVGLWHPARLDRGGVATWPGMWWTCNNPPFTRLIGSGEEPSRGICRWPPPSMEVVKGLRDLPFAELKLVGIGWPLRGTTK